MMPLSDIVTAALSRPAARVFDAPVRELVHEVLQDHGYVGPDELRELQQRNAKLEASVRDMTARLAVAEAAVETLSARVVELDARPLAASASAPVAVPSSTVVGADGLVEVDGQAYRVEVAYAGQPYKVSGTRVRRVYVGGRAVKKRSVAG